MEDANITVVVKQINSRKVYITGQVAKQGPYPLTGPTTVLQLISLAGGVAEFADSKNIMVLRTENGRQVAHQVQLQGSHGGKEARTEHRAQAGRHRSLFRDAHAALRRDRDVAVIVRVVALSVVLFASDVSFASASAQNPRAAGSFCGPLRGRSERAELSSLDFRGSLFGVWQDVLFPARL